VGESIYIIINNNKGVIGGKEKRKEERESEGELFCFCGACLQYFAFRHKKDSF